MLAQLGLAVRLLGDVVAAEVVFHDVGGVILGEFPRQTDRGHSPSALAFAVTWSCHDKKSGPRLLSLGRLCHGSGAY